MVVHQAGFAQTRRVGQHFDRGAVVPVPVENLPAAAQQYLFINFCDWHYTERSFGKGKGAVFKRASVREKTFLSNLLAA